MNFFGLGPASSLVIVWMIALPPYVPSMVPYLEQLPSYAPELNPVEYLWGHLKHHELPNVCAKNLSELSHHAIRALRRLRRRPTLVAAFWKQSGLFENCYL